MLKEFLQIKKIIALLLTIVFCYLAITSKVTSDQYLTVFSLVIAFYFGKSTVRQAVNENKLIEEDHIKLRDLLRDSKGKFLLTINDNDKVREWYKDFNINETEVAYSVCKEEKGRRKFKELIITNY